MLLRFIVGVVMLCIGINASTPIYSQVPKKSTFEWAKNRLMKPSSDKVPHSSLRTEPIGEVRLKIPYKQ